MKKSKNFGVIIACCSKDIHYALGCYASICYFMPNTPVCFLYDGWDTPKSLASIPDIKLLNRSTIKNDFLRERSFGAGFSKMVTFFESPFETFLYLDSDTTVCGDLSKLADFTQFDLIVDKRHSYDDLAIDQWFFNPQKLSKFFHKFDWAKHQDDYFCTGTFFARVGCLELERYVELLNFSDKNPDIFKFWEMGLLNMMIFEA